MATSWHAPVVSSRWMLAVPIKQWKVHHEKMGFDHPNSEGGYKNPILDLTSTPDAYLLTSIQMKRHWMTWDLFWTCAMSILHFFFQYNHIGFDMYCHGTRSRQPVKNAAHCPNLSSLTVVLPLQNHFFQHFKICESFPSFPGTLSWWRWKCIWFEVIPSMKSSAESPVESGTLMLVLQC